MSYYGSVLNIGNLGGDLYLNFTLMVVVELPAKISVLYLIDRIGRKKLYIAFTIIGGTACIGTILPILYKSDSESYHVYFFQYVHLLTIYRRPYGVYVLLYRILYLHNKRTVLCNKKKKCIKICSI